MDCDLCSLFYIKYSLVCQLAGRDVTRTCFVKEYVLQHHNGIVNFG